MDNPPFRPGDLVECTNPFYHGAAKMRFEGGVAPETGKVYVVRECLAGHGEKDGSKGWSLRLKGIHIHKTKAPDGSWREPSMFACDFKVAKSTHDLSTRDHFNHIFKCIDKAWSPVIKEEKKDEPRKDERKGVSGAAGIAASDIYRKLFEADTGRASADVYAKGKIAHPPIKIDWGIVGEIEKFYEPATYTRPEVTWNGKVHWLNSDSTAAVPENEQDGSGVSGLTTTGVLDAIYDKFFKSSHGI